MNWSSKANPSSVKKSTELLRSLTGRFTKIRLAVCIAAHFPFSCTEVVFFSIGSPSYNIITAKVKVCEALM